MVNSTSDEGVDEDHDSVMRERARNHSELMKLIVTASTD
jgi:hypothetical protein